MNIEAYFPIAKSTRATAQKLSVYKSSTKDTNASSGLQGNRTGDYIGSSKAVTNALLKTLSDPLNPITHSDIYERTDHIVSCSSGHQVSNGQRHGVKSSHTVDRTKKLKAQQEEAKSSASSGILKGTRIYIDGYLESTTDIEMKRVVLEAGGQIVHSASRCTHILTSRGLSGSKTHRLLTRQSRNVYVVKPEWVFDSVKAEKRRSERTYAVVTQANTLQRFIEAST